MRARNRQAEGKVAAGDGPEAHISHSAAGRLRIKVPGRRGNTGYFAQAEKRFAECPGVRRVAVNPLTGSILIEHATDTAAILDFAETGDVLSLRPEREAVSLAANLQETAADMDRRLRQAAGDALDLWSATSLIFLALACIQLLRGHYMGPATTLLWTAIAAMRMASR
jgi:Heavy metal associated domain 2